MIFALWELSQLLIGLFYIVIAIKYNTFDVCFYRTRIYNEDCNRKVFKPFI